MTEEQKAKILVADDTPAIRKLLSMFLTKEGYTVVEAADGKEAIDMAESEKPDMILLDIMMPKVFGWDVLQKVKQDNPKIKIIIMSAVYKKSTYRRSAIYDLGADEYVTKPFNIPSLIEMIKEILAKP
jgi:CheY-like chemotaxis protein